MLAKTLVLGAALATLVKAEDVAVNMMMVGIAAQPLVASAVASDATATTFSITCATPSATNCGIPPGFTYTEGPSMMHYSYFHTPTAAHDPEGTVVVTCAKTAVAAETGAPIVNAACEMTKKATMGTITSTAVTSSTSLSSAIGMVVHVTAGNIVLPTTSSSSSSSSSSHTLTPTPKPTTFVHAHNVTSSMSYSSSAYNTTSYSNSSATSFSSIAPVTATSVIVTSEPASHTTSTPSATHTGAAAATGVQWFVAISALMVALAAL